MTECAACGDCCTVIGVTRSPYELAAGAAVINIGDNPDRLNDYQFAAKHWHPLGRKAALKQSPFQRLRGRQVFFYWCDQFNPTTRLCMAQDTKPPVCRDFPWYDRPPSGLGLTIFPRCSYWADVPQAEHPVYVQPLVPLQKELTRAQ